MNQTQTTVGIGGSALTAALTTVLTYLYQLDTATAAAFAFVILFIFGAAYSLVSWFVYWKWPSAPLLPNLSASDAAQLAQAHASAATEHAAVARAAADQATDRKS